MEINFGEPHMRTLKKLNEMAEKNGCVIRFGFNSEVSSDVDEDLISKKDKKVFKRLEFGFDPEQSSTDTSKVYFELDTKDGTCLISLVYAEKSTFFKLSDSDIEELEGGGVETEYMDGSIEGNNGLFQYNDSPTTIWIKGRKEPIKDYRVYRPGMALKYFSDIICEHFNEPQIEETY